MEEAMARKIRKYSNAGCEGSEYSHLTVSRTEYGSIGDGPGVEVAIIGGDESDVVLNQAEIIDLIAQLQKVVGKKVAAPSLISGAQL